jgi:hypothetical protein
MQCSLTITPHYLQSNDASRPFGDNARILSAITEHPGPENAWDAFQGLLIAGAATLGTGLISGGVTAAALGAATLKWVSDELEAGASKEYGDVKTITFPAGALYWCRSQGKPVVDWGDQLMVSFRAWSEDEIKSDADGHVGVPSGTSATGIIDQGGGYHQTDGTYFYDRSFLIPLRTLPVGIYSISFTATDDGWFFDVGVSEVLYIKVEENQYPMQPVQASPITLSPPSAADTRKILGSFTQARAYLKAPSADVKPKRSLPRLDGRVPIPLETAMDIPFSGQKPAATPQMNAPTVLPAR